MRWIRHNLIWLVAFVGLIHFLSGLVVDRFMARQPIPLVGLPHSTDANRIERCDVYLTALFLVRDTLRLGYRDDYSAVNRGFRNIRSDQCRIGNWSQPKTLLIAEQKFVRDFRRSGLNLIEAAEREPHWLSPKSFLQGFGILSRGSDPIGSMSYVRSMIEEYAKINSGRGLKHYLECDYNIRKEPEFSYHIANYYIRQQLGDAAKRFDAADFRRIENCGYKLIIEDELARRLQNWHIPMSPSVTN